METTQSSIASICDHIARLLSSDKNPGESIPFLSSKNVGALLFLSHYLPTPLAAEEEEKILALCEAIIQELFTSAQEAQVSFSSGLIGYAWLLAYLENEEKFEFADSELHQQIQAIALNFALQEISEKDNLDFLHGGLGAAFYFLERHRMEDQSAALNQIFSAIEAKAIKVEQGTYWKDITAPEAAGLKNCNLGVAHGLPSVLYFLSALVKNNIAKARAKALLQESIRFLLHCKNGPESRSIFPSVFSFESPNNPSRLGWCYGDLGIALVLYVVAAVLEEEELKQEAIDIGLHCTHRLAFDNTRILDAGLCHGAAGVSHLYHRMYLHTGHSAFKQAAKEWLDKTIQSADKEAGLAGFQLWNPASGWENSYGFLEGIAGIGLALWTQESQQDPKWDRMLLIS